MAKQKRVVIVHELKPDKKAVPEQALSPDMSQNAEVLRSDRRQKAGLVSRSKRPKAAILQVLRLVKSLKEY